MQGRNAEAIVKFQKAIEIDPMNAPAYYNFWGRLLSSLGKNDEAEEKFRIGERLLLQR
jgi:tetratricopeptide (TPR) repeat protein